MPAASSEIAKLKREITTLREIVTAGRGGRGALSDADRRNLKSEVDWCIQELDELRSKLSR